MHYLRSLRSFTRAGALLPFLAALLAAPAAAQQQSVGQPAGNPADTNWTTYGGNLFNQRYSSLKQITTSNVANLKGAWTYHIQGGSPAASFESSPIVVDGVMYLSGPQSQVWALDAKTGQQIWAYTPDLAFIAGLPLCCGQVNRGVAVGEGKVFVGRLDATLVALDAQTGRELWRVSVADAAAGYSETMAPLYYNGLVYIGSSGAEYEIRGHVTAYSAADGRQVWRFFTIPAPAEFGGDTWPQDTDFYLTGGGSSWQTPALDPDLGLLYITVGNPSPDLDGSPRQGDNLFTESIVALDARTGQRKWHFQQIHHDLWDYDTVSPNVLFDVSVNGQMRRALGEAGKTGWVYLLDRETGQPLVGIDERPVGQDAQQFTSPTQPFPQGDAFVAQRCTQPIANYPMADIFSPFEQQPVLICPGANGGSEWSPSSFSPQTNNMYVCGINQPQIWTSRPDLVEPGTLRLGSAFVTPPGGETSGTFTAIDVRTNRKAWQAQWDQPCIGGSMATAGGLVFAGEGNGNFNAYDASNGARLWQFQTGAGANAPAVSYQVGDTQYVAVASGGNFQLNFPRGDTLWVFALNGNIGPVAAPAPQTPTESAATVTDSPRIVDFEFQPGAFIIPPGTTVTWVNDGPSVHTSTSDNRVWDSGLLQPGQSFSFTFDKPGTYSYFCAVHPFMQARLIVDTNAPPLANAADASNAPPNGPEVNP